VRLAIVSREQFGPCQTVLDLYSSGISDRVKIVAAANLVEVAALVGDTARATMLNALMGGQSLTATELAYCANVSRATTADSLALVKRHLAQMLQVISFWIAALH
jgi:hypothetical protein